MTGSDQPQPAPAAGVDELQADIERTRAELGATTKALTNKLDVKARAGEAASDAKDRVVEKAVPISAIAAAAVAVVLGVAIWRRRKR
jgi:ElaB/YqjD/DUF883 family membrane-anchored ribosome-binding protein